VENWASILPLVLLVVAFIFLVVRPARARQREFQSLQSQLEPGQRVMLASGIFGELVTIGDDTVELQIAPGTVVTVNRHAVSRVVPAAPVTDSETGTEL
jgi:preprotein translocase subunit YajC